MNDTIYHGVFLCPNINADIGLLKIVKKPCWQMQLIRHPRMLFRIAKSTFHFVKQLFPRILPCAFAKLDKWLAKFQYAMPMIFALAKNLVRSAIPEQFVKRINIPIRIGAHSPKLYHIIFVLAIDLKRIYAMLFQRTIWERKHTKNLPLRCLVCVLDALAILANATVF